MRSVTFEFVSGLAAEFGAVECCWRESERSFTGFFAECWFAHLPSSFAARWVAVVPLGQVLLRGGQRGACALYRTG